MRARVAAAMLISPMALTAPDFVQMSLPWVFDNEYSQITFSNNSATFPVFFGEL